MTTYCGDYSHPEDVKVSDKKNSCKNEKCGMSCAEYKDRLKVIPISTHAIKLNRYRLIFGYYGFVVCNLARFSKIIL
jgi:hypothetical protein